MRCDGCTRPVHHVDNGVEFCKICDFSTASLYEKPKGSLVNPPEQHTDEQHLIQLESLRWAQIRQHCLRTLKLPTLINAYRVITNQRDYARSFLAYADKHGIQIPNREHFERMAK